MVFRNIWTMLFLAVIAINAANAASAASGGAGAPGTDELSSLSCISTCSRLILEADFDPSKNKVVAGDQVLMMLNLLSNLPGDNPLRAELEARGILVDPKAFADYSAFITHSNVVDVYSAVLLPKALDPRMVPPAVRTFGADVQLILDKDKTKENAKRINDSAKRATRGKISHIVTPEGLSGVGLAAITASYYKSFWNEPFEEEGDDTFRTIGGTKTVTYLKGPKTCGYKQNASGEVISIPLKNGTQFIVFKPSSVSIPRLFDPSMLVGIEEKRIYLSLPKLNIKNNTSLKDFLRKAGFTGIDKNFLDGRIPLDDFHQKMVLKTTLQGLEAAAITAIRWKCKLQPVDIDCPHSIALVMPLPDGTCVPLFMGYIGDPTLS